jgi:hypothetical protein
MFWEVGARHALPLQIIVGRGVLQQFQVTGRTEVSPKFTRRSLGKGGSKVQSLPAHGGVQSLPTSQLCFAVYSVTQSLSYSVTSLPNHLHQFPLQKSLPKNDFLSRFQTNSDPQPAPALAPRGVGTPNVKMGKTKHTCFLMFLI